MIYINNIVTTLTLSILLFSNAVISDGLFYLQRIPSSCIATSIDTVTNNNISDNCFIFDWNQITNSTTYYTAYMDPNTNKTFYAQMGALTVLGKIDNYNLSYQCPPVGYNGVGPDCNTPPNTQLVILHINTIDGKLYAIDVILSGAPFPSPQDLKDNQPPFGKARHIFNSGITIASSGYLRICKTNTSDQCPNKNLDANKLPNPLPSNYGYGIFGIQASNTTLYSTWIMDDPNQLLIVTLGTTYYYFNGSGFFLYNAQANQCTWYTACDYKCEVYNYNSRFLDYAGEWLITYKWGVGTINYVSVDAWIGNAIDAAGIFPVIMFTDKKTGDYIGLDKLDTVGSRTMGASYWYTEHGPTIPRTSIEAFHPNVVQGNCTSNLSDWAGSEKNSGITLRWNYFQLMLLVVVLICFYTFHIY